VSGAAENRYLVLANPNTQVLGLAGIKMSGVAIDSGFGSNAFSFANPPTSLGRVGVLSGTGSDREVSRFR
jgi:hypothetical protein